MGQCHGGGLSNTPSLHRLPVQYDPVTRWRGPFVAPSVVKGQLKRGLSQLGKQCGGGRALPRLPPALPGPAAMGRSRIPHATGARGNMRTHGTCGTASPGVLGRILLASR